MGREAQDRQPADKRGFYISGLGVWSWGSQLQLAFYCSLSWNCLSDLMLHSSLLCFSPLLCFSSPLLLRLGREAAFNYFTLWLAGCMSCLILRSVWLVSSTINRQRQSSPGLAKGRQRPSKTVKDHRHKRPPKTRPEHPYFTPIMRVSQKPAPVCPAWGGESGESALLGLCAYTHACKIETETKNAPGVENATRFT